MTPVEFAAALWHLPQGRLGRLRKEDGLWTDPLSAEVQTDDTGHAYEIVARMFARTNPVGPHTRTAIDFPILAAMTHHAHPGHAVEGRFGEALMARLDTVDRYIQPIILLAAQDDLAPTWGTLLENLCRWDNDNREMQLIWSRAFWGWRPHQPAESISDMLTTAEVADMLGVKASRVRRLILSGELATTKRGRDNLIQRADAEAMRGRNQSPGRPRRKTNESP